MPIVASGVQDGQDGQIHGRRTDKVEDSVSTASRARALAEPASQLTADAGLLRHLPPSAIGLTRSQWTALLRDAALRQALASLEEALAEVRANAAATGAGIGRDLRPAAMSFAGLARKLARML